MLGEKRKDNWHIHTSELYTVVHDGVPPLWTSGKLRLTDYL